jgi:2-oxoisovalerate dehydrogenase E2 component (dihydrolipoyl transacylase)
VAELKQFRLPDVGEGLTEAEILTWHVKPGDSVKVNQIIVEIETAKSAVELPSPFEGVVAELHAPEGQMVDVGAPIITIDVAPDEAPASTAPPIAAAGSERLAGDDLVPPIPADEAASEPGIEGGPAPGARTPVLVGYGPRTTEAKRRPRKPEGASEVAQARSTAAADSKAPVTPTATAPAAAAPAVSTQADRTGPVLAKPPVRKLAKDLGVDLRVLKPTGPSGTVTRQDVEAAVAPAVSPETPAAREEARPTFVPTMAEAYDFDPVSREYRYPIRSVRRTTAAAMVQSAFTAPHVTEFMTVDVTRTMQLVERLSASRDFAGIKVSPLAVVAKALLLAVRRNPDINATWDEERQEIVVKGYVNLGIAAATPRGLMVPNIKDAHSLTLPALAQAINALAATARDGKTPPSDMTGGTITITNVGVFGVDTGTPILNPGEAAILCFGAIRDMPWVHEGEIAVRKVTTLSVSFDHRLVDGELGSRFIADIATVLENPDTALVWS